MNFEHVVVINEPDNPLQPKLTREQTWFGLLYRAEDPRLFLPGLESCSIVERSQTSLLRDLDFGNVVIRDRVEIELLQAVTFISEASQSHAGGSLRISIEEPLTDQLVLRFCYKTTLGEQDSDPDGAYADFVKSAYHQSDLDTVRVIRLLTEKMTRQ